ncbi:hypothetical protein WH47_01984 [Habropoda laboriosa]|uniref:Uncharacterized protein n=1 Tax=Habropoda laboriosa TaxID=597456 RepID=A0A0L7R0B0_9HYME|nr:hypothetical protein WH47_01984 [Habropoda laboriosa]
MAIYCARALENVNAYTYLYPHHCYVFYTCQAKNLAAQVNTITCEWDVFISFITHTSRDEWAKSDDKNCWKRLGRVKKFWSQRKLRLRA